MTRNQTDSRSHRGITDLLPWYVNGTLSPAEREEVAAHLAGCPDCLAETGMLQSISSVVKDSNERLPLPSDGQLNVLLSRIEKEGAARGGRRPFARLKEWWATLPPLAKWALAALAVAVIALACASAALLRRANLSEAAALRERRRAETLQERERAEAFQERLRAEALQQRQRAEALQARLRADRRESAAAERGRETKYQSLSGPRKEVAGPVVKITVVFHEDATAKEIRDLLKAVPAKIVSSPSSAGHYDLAIAVPPGADAQKLAAAALARLNGRPDVVRMAELVP